MTSSNRKSDEPLQGKIGQKSKRLSAESMLYVPPPEKSWRAFRVLAVLAPNGPPKDWNQYEDLLRSRLMALLKDRPARDGLVNYLLNESLLDPYLFPEDLAEDGELVEWLLESDQYQYNRHVNLANDWWNARNHPEGRRCWLCGQNPGRLEAHEFWDYQGRQHVQVLLGIHHLCPMCHRVKHYAFWCNTDDGHRLMAQMGFTEADLIEHFCQVNQCKVADFEHHKRQVAELWTRRSDHEWTQDVSMLRQWLGDEEYSLVARSL